MVSSSRRKRNEKKKRQRGKEKSGARAEKEEGREGRMSNSYFANKDGSPFAPENLSELSRPLRHFLPQR